MTEKMPVSEKKNICLVTDELMDIPPSGGVGTATQFLARFLKKNHFSVKILFTSSRLEFEKFDLYKRHFSSTYGLDVDFLVLSLYSNWNPDFLRRSKAVLDYFSSSNVHYDVILFHELWHDGYLCLKCKSIMPCFQQTVLGVICHSSHQWIQESHGYNIGDYFAIHSELERQCVGLADFVISPSRYMVDWMKRKGWPLPDHVQILPHAMEPIEGWLITDNQLKLSYEFDEIIFFGRIESRKGIFIFLDALKYVPSYLLSGKTITFLGREIIERTELIERLKALDLPINECRWIYYEDYNQVREYLRKPGRLTIMPSPADNSPCVIYECLIDNVPFICANNGGQSELIHEDYHNYCLFNPIPERLAEKLVEILTNDNYEIPKPSKDLMEASKTNLAVFNSYVEMAQRKITINLKYPTSHVSIIITMLDDKKEILDVICAIFNQTYNNYDIFIIGNISVSLKNRILDLKKNKSINQEVTFFQSKNYSKNNTRNIVSLKSKGNYLLFLDETVILDPEYLEKCLNVTLLENADCVVTSVNCISENGSNSYWIPAGGGAQKDFFATSIFNNLYGGKCILVKRSVYEICQIQEPYISGMSEWSLLLDLHLSQYRISVNPEPLYALKEGNILQKSSTPREFAILAKILEKHKKYDFSFLGELYLFKDKSLSPSDEVILNLYKSLYIKIDEFGFSKLLQFFLKHFIKLNQ
ncbi:glycosyltransferase [uncultured Methanospirillum sp.]|uniref:glycosyltransferase n=1 Tax=uncultured Methanospirillum sp. TaxID=262503 RepID=UPI0029C79A4F|nr:glycosyltransferase [uncultured Methanospirillum sp.]